MRGRILVRRRLVLFRKTIVVMLTVILLNTCFGIQSLRAQTGKDAAEIEKARATVQQLGVGQAARVEVKLKDNTKMKGYISATGEDSFTVVDSRTNIPQTLAYTDLKQVKKPGSNFSMRTIAIIGAVVAAAVIVGVTVVKPVACDGGAGC
jgi:hypothetical protein